MSAYLRQGCSEVLLAFGISQALFDLQYLSAGADMACSGWMSLMLLACSNLERHWVEDGMGRFMMGANLGNGIKANPWHQDLLSIESLPGGFLVSRLLPKMVVMAWN